MDQAAGALMSNGSSSPCAPKRRKCLLVLGMHRSGTSALSGLLAHMGAQRPKRELPPQPDNQLGFFEPSEVVAIHDRFLSALGTTWNDWRKLPDDWRRSQPFEEALSDLETAVRHDFDGTGAFVVKDPRICRFPDLWIELAERMQVDLVAIHVFRTPVEVASSLRVRNGFDEAHTHLLWLRHVLEAEYATRKIPRAFVSYEGLLTDGVREVERALESLDAWIETDISAHAAAETFIDPALNRQAAGADAETRGRWAKSAYAMLGRLRLDPSDRATLNALDRLRSQFDCGCEAFGPVLATTSEKAVGLEQEICRLRAVENERNVLFGSLRAVTWVADRLPALESELDSARSRMSEMSAEASHAAGLDRDLAAERGRLSDATAIAARVPDLEDRLAAARLQVGSLESDMRERTDTLANVVAERDRLLGELGALLEVRTAELAALRQEAGALSAIAERVPSLESDIATARAELGDEKRRHAETRFLADRLPHAEAEHMRLSAQLREASERAAQVPQLDQALAEAASYSKDLTRQLSSRKTLIWRLVFANA